MPPHSTNIWLRPHWTEKNGRSFPTGEPTHKPEVRWWMQGRRRLDICVWRLPETNRTVCLEPSGIWKHSMGGRIPFHLPIWLLAANQPKQLLKGKDWSSKSMRTIIRWRRVFPVFRTGKTKQKDLMLLVRKLPFVLKIINLLSFLMECRNSDLISLWEKHSLEIALIHWWHGFTWKTSLQTSA